MNRVFADNAKINTKINAKFVMHLLQSSKHSCEIHRVVQISRMHHYLVFFPCLVKTRNCLARPLNQLQSLMD